MQCTEAQERANSNSEKLVCDQDFASLGWTLPNVEASELEQQV